MRTTTAVHPLSPLLIYDGDCRFCLYWVHYWKVLTGDLVTYAPYQEVANRFPEIPLSDYQRAVQYIAPDGSVASGAEACFLTLSQVKGKKLWLALYRRLPGFAAITEFVYALVASHRSALHRPTRWLWGPDYEPARYDLVSWLFLRVLGLIYLSAFASFSVQALGLIGSHGILPLSEFVAAIRSQGGVERYWWFPMVFWLDQSDLAIQALCWAGIALSVLLI